jgi:tRNA A-37 threonylcarbamoyl transferase component Bud32
MPKTIHDYSVVKLRELLKSKRLTYSGLNKKQLFSKYKKCSQKNASCPKKGQKKPQKHVLKLPKRVLKKPKKIVSVKKIKFVLKKQKPNVIKFVMTKKACEFNFDKFVKFTKVFIPNVRTHQLQQLVHKEGSVCNAFAKLFVTNGMKFSEPVRYLGGGSFGQTVLMKNPSTGKTVAMKYLLINNRRQPLKDILTEINHQKYFGKIFGNLVPKIYGTHTLKKQNASIYAIEMDVIDGNLHEYLRIQRSQNELDSVIRDIKQIVLKMKKHKITHGDFHAENLGFVKKNNRIQVQLIDFGWSSKQEFFPEMDIPKLMWSLSNVFNDIPRTNTNYLMTELYQIGRKLVREARANNKQLRVSNVSMPWRQQSLSRHNNVVYRQYEKRYR